LDSKAKHVETIKKLLLFSSSSSSAVSLEGYVKNMKEGQPQIYFATGLKRSIHLVGPNMDQIKVSPFAEKVIKRGYEVILVSDPLEEYVFTEKMKEYDGIPLQNVVKAGLKYGDEGISHSPNSFSRCTIGKRRGNSQGGV
jgi:heat shock protein beta